jgi:hypothetical protein
MATVSARYGSGVYGSSAYGLVNLSKAITGVAGTVGAPSVTQTHTSNVSLTGVSATGAVSTTTQILIVAISGSTATGSISSLSPSIAESLLSAPATGTIGTVGTTAVVFDFNAVRELYDRRRTAVVDRAA